MQFNSAFIYLCFLHMLVNITMQIINHYAHFCRLLIGAPRAKALFNQGANITGGLYSCDITTHRDDCVRIEFDNDG